MISASSSRKCTRSILPFEFAIDEFVHVQEPADGRILRFLRDETREVNGLTIDYYRVNGIRFTKR